MLIYKETFKDLKSFTKNNKPLFDGDNIVINNGLTQDSNDVVRSSKLTELLFDKGRYSKFSFIFEAEFPNISNGAYQSLISLRGTYAHFEVGLYRDGSGNYKLYVYNVYTGVVTSSILNETYTVGEKVKFAYSIGYATDKVYYYTNKENAGYSTLVMGNRYSSSTELLCRIGNAGNFDGQFFNGKIYNIAMYDIALSEEEINAEFNGTTDNIKPKDSLIWLTGKREDIYIKRDTETINGTTITAEPTGYNYRVMAEFENQDDGWDTTSCGTTTVSYVEGYNGNYGISWIPTGTLGCVMKEVPQKQNKIRRGDKIRFWTKGVTAFQIHDGNSLQYKITELATGNTWTGEGEHKLCDLFNNGTPYSNWVQFEVEALESSNSTTYLYFYAHSGETSYLDHVEYFATKTEVFGDFENNSDDGFTFGAGATKSFVSGVTSYTEGVKIYGSPTTTYLYKYSSLQGTRFRVGDQIRFWTKGYPRVMAMESGASYIPIKVIKLSTGETKYSSSIISIYDEFNSGNEITDWEEYALELTEEVLNAVYFKFHAHDTDSAETGAMCLDYVRIIQGQKYMVKNYGQLGDLELVLYRGATDYPAIRDTELGINFSDVFGKLITYLDNRELNDTLTVYIAGSQDYKLKTQTSYHWGFGTYNDLYRDAGQYDASDLTRNFKLVGTGGFSQFGETSDDSPLIWSGDAGMYKKKGAGKMFYSFTNNRTPDKKVIKTNPIVVGGMIYDDEWASGDNHRYIKKFFFFPKALTQEQIDRLKL